MTSRRCCARSARAPEADADIPSRWCARISAETRRPHRPPSQSQRAKANEGARQSRTSNRTSPSHILAHDYRCSFEVNGKRNDGDFCAECQLTVPGTRHSVLGVTVGQGDGHRGQWRSRAGGGRSAVHSTPDSDRCFSNDRVRHHSRGTRTAAHGRCPRSRQERPHGSEPRVQSTLGRAMSSRESQNRSGASICTP